MVNVAAFFLALLFSAQVFGQETIYLIRIVDADAERATTVWWEGGSAAYSNDDKALITTAQEQNLNLIQPADLSQISKILRQPILSDANAANLARLLGASVAVVGVIEMSQSATLSVLPIFGFQAKLSGKILKFNGNEVVARDVEINQHGYSQDLMTARASALNQLGKRLALGLRETPAGTSGPVGVDTRFPVLKFDGLQTGRAFDLVTAYLVELGPVEDVEVVWVGRGQVTLKVVDRLRKSLEHSEVEQIARSLVNAPFEGFQLSMAAESSTDSFEFRIVPTTIQR